MALNFHVDRMAGRAGGRFEEVAGEQLAATVDQLLLAYNVQEPDVWAPIVKRLADEAAGMLSPGKAVAYGNLDPRFYIKVRAQTISLEHCKNC